MEIQKIYNQALKKHKENNLQNAEKLYKEILVLDPKHFESIYLLGTLYFQKKEFDKAKIKFKEAYKIQNNHAELCNIFGATLINLGEYQESINYFKKAIQNKPNYSHAYNNLGSVLIEVEQHLIAINYLQKAIQIEPKLIDAYINLGIAYKELGNFHKAIDCFQVVIKINSKNIKAHQNLMESYEKTNQEKNLEESILNAKNLFKDNMTVRLYEGIFLYRKEKFNETKNYLESISFDKQNIKNEIIRAFTLAKCYDRLGDNKNAFKYFLKANTLAPQLKRKNIFDKKKYIESIKIRQKFFQLDIFKKWENINIHEKSVNPIFLIGFPRSGTTLLDTILRAHPSIEVIEEKPMVKEMVDSLNEFSNGDFKKLEKIKDKQIKKSAQIYFDCLNAQIKNKSNSKIYIDKFPLNIIHVGEILRVFPHAKFILSIRHPHDCVLSCFMQNFKLNNAMANFLNLSDSAYLYDNVMNLWAQYTSIFKINYHEVKYENLVKDLKSNIISLLNFLEVPWNDEVLNFSKKAQNRKNIATPSYNQVTKKLYSYASGRWKNYKNEISDVSPILDKWVKKYKY